MAVDIQAAARRFLIMKLCELWLCRVALIAVLYALFVEMFGGVVLVRAVVVGGWTSAATMLPAKLRYHPPAATRVPLVGRSRTPALDPGSATPIPQSSIINFILTSPDAL